MQYTRLDDREKRHNKDLGRKQVFLCKHANPPFVETHFSPSSAQLYHNSRLAFDTVSPVFIGKLIEAHDEKLILKIQYVGKSLSPTPENLADTVQFLEKFSASTSYSEFKHWRYLQLFAKTTGDPAITAFVEAIMSAPFSVRTGNGIDDPVISNFTRDDEGVHLVDLDYFSPDHSLNYQVGFVMADVDILSESPLASTLKEIRRRYHAYGLADSLSHQEIAALLTGYVSKLGISVINSRIGLPSPRHSDAFSHALSLISDFRDSTGKEI